MSKILLIVTEKMNYFFPYVDNRNIVIDNCWDKEYLKKHKRLVDLCMALHFPLPVFFGKWTRQIADFSKIIIFDGCFNALLKLYLDIRVPGTPKFIFCWNSKERWDWVIPDINRRGKRRYPMFSYSLKDSKELGINYLHTFYTDNIKLETKKNDYDLVFVGRTKQRMELINKIYNYSNDNNLKLFLYVCDKENRPYPTSDTLLRYGDYLEIVSRSKAILDLTDQNHDGLSLRVMEALFFDKKLITDNEAIIKCDFYRKENIFILRGEDWQGMTEFLKIPYKEIPNDTKMRYTIENWVEEFKEDFFC